ncbi:ATP synthase F1 subunit delta [Bowdeniella nasicola]|uniref:ATP synthase subunit delta n=1 Tax=Bowdeniella nasicola TaxID=208480 RepID=A0A1Q5Q365_9ACTO|nr:F0F1 ATP synthase subunit delta [Bowdeniella nasicola]OKL54205.1 ATP synthase F1 subunit delta [Bowdeniella nasicola]
MRAASQAGLSAAAERWEGVLAMRGADGIELATELFSVVDTLDSEPGLRRALTDPARDGGAKAELATTVFGGKVNADVVDLLAGMVRGRWSAEGDLADAVAEIAMTSALASAEAHDRLLDVEAEVFQLTRMLTDQRSLRMALADRELPASNRVQLVDQLFGDKLSPETLLLVRRVAATLRGRTVPSALAEIGDLAAARRQRIVATVTVAMPLSSEQLDRLAAALEAKAGQAVHININVDPSVLGGLRVQLGTDVVDDTIRARLDQAGRAISG